MQEKRPIPNYDGYFADIYGNIWSNKFNKWRKLKASLAGSKKHYLDVCLINNEGKQKFINVHSLIAKAFLGEKANPKWQICHKDGNKLNNMPGNLRYGTAKSNYKDRIKHGTHLLTRGHKKRQIQTSLFATE